MLFWGIMGTSVTDFGGAAARIAAVGAVCLLLANCSASSKFAKRVDPKYGVSTSPRVIGFDEAVPKGGGTYRIGKPYVVAGRTYVPEENPNYRAEGLASWYGDAFHGRLTANGEVFDMTSLTAAHPTLPLPSYARVTNLANGKSVIVRVNDRGPYHGNRLIDVSNTAARLLEFRENGIGRVRVEYVGRAPLEGSDDRQLMATLRTGEPAPVPSAVRVASARPFVPEMAPSRGVVRGDIPLPEGRPYSLGNTAEDMAAAGPSEVSASRSMRSAGRQLAPSRTASVDGSTLDAQAMMMPTAAYAPVARDSGRGLMSGRGLY
jgi:rare lipoprotein A